jgi:cyclopropane-fatty-acyl-phospholipid synthase
MSILIDLAESRRFPDLFVKLGIRHLVGQRLQQEHADDVEWQAERYQRLVDELRSSRIALDTERANEQHYELPAQFFAAVLGRHLKYSSCYWERGAADLDEAEVDMLELYVERADIRDGQKVLDLGCGWGSFTLWAAERFPASHFTAVSNARGQREFIEQTARRRRLANVTVMTADVNELQFDARFDRVISVEMFEHVRNYALLLNRISSWLKADGKLFVHIFCHQNLLYPFETTGDGNWMGRHFFTGGLMPAADTLLHFQDDLRIERRWRLSGTNYQKTARAWLNNMDLERAAVDAAMESAYGHAEAPRWRQRWRMFFMACEEMFGFRHGQEWLVCHYLFGKRDLVK